MKNNLYIPKKLKVGFQIREGTYTGKLGYVIYQDDKKVWRKEPSWESWRHKENDKPFLRWEDRERIYGEEYGDKVSPLFLENDPLEGFVLNKKAGGVGSSWGWNDRVEKVRVFDPRGFEFEISIPNLLFILEESNSYKGKGLEGEFIYAWDKKELVLMPIQSSLYQKCLGHTKLQAKKVSLKDLKTGFNYKTKDNKNYCYIGYDNFISGYYPFVKITHIFYDLDDEIFCELNSNNLAEEIGENNCFSDIVDILKATKHCLKILKIEKTEEVDILSKKEENHSHWSYCRFRERYEYSGLFMTLNNNIYNLYNQDDYYGRDHKISFKLKNGIIRKTKPKNSEIIDYSNCFKFKFVFENGEEYNPFFEDYSEKKEFNKLNKLVKL